MGSRVPNWSLTGPDTMSRTNLRNVRRRGVGLYLATLMLSLLVTGTGATLISMQMSARHLQDNLDGADQSALVGQAGMEWALMTVQNDPDWRTSADDYDYGEVMLDLAPYGSVEVTITDPDGDFLDDDTDTATLTISSDVDGAVQAFEATLEPYPSDALRHAVYAANWVYAGAGATVLGPVHANSGIWLDDGSVITGDDASFTVLSGGVLHPALPNASYVESAAPVPTPDLSFYTDRATSLFNGGPNFDLNKAALTATYSNQGATNSDGIYHIDAGGREVRVKDLYLKGTLIVTNTGGRPVKFEEGCRLEVGDQEYPTLLIDCNPADLTLTIIRALDEDARNVDYNNDGDQEDTFQSGLYGLIWTNANNTTLDGSDMSLQGSIMGSTIHLRGTTSVDDDPDLATRMIPGFTDGMLHFQRGSMREIDP